MADLSRLKVIRSKPIGDALNAFRDSFKALCEDLKVSVSIDALQHIAHESLQDLALDLISALLILPASRILPSSTGSKNFFGDLSRLNSAVNSDDFDVDRVKPLLRAVINNESDDVIWDKAYTAVAEFTPPRPLSSLTGSIFYSSAAFDTPIRSSSASQRGVEQTHDEVDQRIIEELTGRVYCDVEGFYERYFDGKSWTNIAKNIYKASKAQHVDDCWSGWPEPSLETTFFKWFMNFQDTVFSGLHHKYYTSANKVLRGSEADRKLDIFLATIDTASPNGEHDWSDVLVIGEHKQNSDEDRSTKTLVQLAGYAREVFGSQPDRRFVPGFTICGSVMRLWVFDRSGAYSSEKLDIHKEPERFVNALAGYALMTDAELGLNTFIESDGGGKYVLAHETRIYLEDKPIASTKAIVCRATVCYRGRDAESTEWKYVVKLAWPSDQRQREGSLLELAKKRRVTGVAELVSHGPITINGDPDTISFLRRAMIFGAPRKLSNKAFWVDSGAASSQASRTRGRSKSRKGRLRGISANSTTMSSSGQKRKRDEALVNWNAGMKRSKSRDSQSTIVVVGAAVEENASDAGDIYSVEDSLAGGEIEAYGNRIHCCLVISPAGRPLHEYTTVLELLEVLRDAIAGHKSLLEDGKILHRDISENNIIITELIDDGGLRGRLIDLDLAKELDSRPSGASYRTGTMQFMAIEVLQGKGHTYRHDLESFFYVLIWMCIRYGYEDVGGMSGPHRPTANKRRTRVTSTSRLQGWYSGTYSEIGRNKLGDMDKNGFEGIVAEFSPQFKNLKQLSRELRTVLFPIRDGAIFTGTFRENGIMYDGMINAFNKAISNL